MQCLPATTSRLRTAGSTGTSKACWGKWPIAETTRKCKVWYLEEKQYLLLLRVPSTASERVANYLEHREHQEPEHPHRRPHLLHGNNPQSQLGVDWSCLLSSRSNFRLTAAWHHDRGSSSTASTIWRHKLRRFPTYNSLTGLASSFGHPDEHPHSAESTCNATLNFCVNDTRAETITEPSAITANGRESPSPPLSRFPTFPAAPSPGNGYGSCTGSGYDQHCFFKRWRFCQYSSSHPGRQAH